MHNTTNLCPFEYYVMNEDFNRKVIEPFNVFRNSIVRERVHKTIAKYLRNPSKFEHRTYRWQEEDEVIYGWDALVKEVNIILRSEEWCRSEYEVVIGSMFDKNGESFRRIDCYEQCEKNMEMIVRECIYQYKEWKKGQKNGQSSEQ